MNNLPVAETVKTSYENFTIKCPFCEKNITFNRATDLGTFEPIAGRNIKCKNTECGKEIRILNDSANSPHEKLVFDCNDLLHKEEYMRCIQNLVQSYEVFFYLFFKVELLYKPYANRQSSEIHLLNSLSETLDNKIKKHSFSRLRSLFLYYHIKIKSPHRLSDVQAILDVFPKELGDPKDEEIQNLKDKKLSRYLLMIKNTKIHEIRNKVSHTAAYRPTRDEAQSALKETKEIIFPLTYYLEIFENINYYKHFCETQ